MVKEVKPMMRYSIRDSRSRKKIKPRICDVIVEDDGKMEVEFLGKQGARTIALEDFEKQLNEIKQEHK